MITPTLYSTCFLLSFFLLSFFLGYLSLFIHSHASSSSFFFLLFSFDHTYLCHPAVYFVLLLGLVVCSR